MRDIKDICFIRAKLKRDYVVDGLVKKGYKSIIPYKDYNLFLRIMREAWYRMGLPKQLWFNPEIRKITNQNIVICDPLVCPELVSYVVKYNPGRNIFLTYANRVRTTINPNAVQEPSVIKVTYDKTDSSEYNLHYIAGGYQDVYKIEEVKGDLFDVAYVGRDKGRGDKILDIEKKMRQMGLKTYFHICGDRRFINKHKKYYKPVLEYTEYLNILSRSKSLLNIMPEDQNALTTRDFEVIFNGIKGITNNKWIKDFALYDPTRFFVLGEDDIESLPTFINTPFKKIDENLLLPYTEDFYLNKLLELVDSV